MKLKHERQFPGATPYTDARGKRRWRFRRKGFSAELGTNYGSPEFIARYEAAQQRQQMKGMVGASRTRPGSLSSVVASWKDSPKVRGWKASTHRTYVGVAEALREKHGDKRIAHLETRHIEILMAEKADTPNAANRIRLVMKMLLDHAIKMGLRTDNPARDAETYRVSPDGFHTWREDEIERFYAHHQIGTIAHTAMTLMLYTGAARIDAVSLGWGSVQADRIRYRRQKMEGMTDIVVDIPIHPDLVAVLDALPRDAFTFLQTQQGSARSPNGLGNLMREACDAAGLPNCTAHGLRKACARRLAEAQCTPHEIAAITGHATLKEVERYTRAADRSGMADSAFAKLADRVKREQRLTNISPMFVKKGEN